MKRNIMALLTAMMLMVSAVPVHAAAGECHEEDER